MRASILGVPKPFALALMTVLWQGGWQAQSSEVTYRFTGVITNIAKSLVALTPPTELTNLFQPGGTWTADFTFEDQSPDVEPANIHAGFYQHAGRHVSFDYSSGAYVGSLSGTQLNVITYSWPPSAPGLPSADALNLWAVTRYAPPDSQQNSFAPLADLRMLALGFSLVDNTGTVLSSDAIPSIVNLGDYDQREFSMEWGVTDGGPFFRLQGFVASVTLVPEPSSWIMLATVLPVLLAFRMRSIHHRSG